MATTKLSTTIAGIVAGATGATGPTGPTGATGATGASGATTTISNGTSNLNIASSGGSIFANTAGTTAVTIDTSQNVGIGTSSPVSTSKLTVNGSISVNGADTNFGAGGQRAFIDYTTNVARIGAISGGVATGTAVAFYVGNVGGSGFEAARIDSSGNVGIGTTSPSTRLSLQLSSATTYTTSTRTNQGLTIYNSSATTNGFTGIEFVGEPTSGNGGIAGIGSVVTGSGSANLVFGTRDSATYAERMRIDSSGRVLVGLTSPNTSGANFQVSQGVTFPATQSASSDANTLDDYEEGSFTPIFAAVGGTVPTTQTGTGAYIKVGRVVHLHGQISWTGSGSAGSNLRVDLPFIVVSGARGALALGIISGFNWSAGHQLTLLPELNTTVAYFVSKDPAGGGHVHRTLSDVSTTGSYLFSFAGSYVTSN